MTNNLDLKKFKEFNSLKINSQEWLIQLAKVVLMKNKFTKNEKDDLLTLFKSTNLFSLIINYQHERVNKLTFNLNNDSVSKKVMSSSNLMFYFLDILNHHSIFDDKRFTDEVVKQEKQILYNTEENSYVMNSIYQLYNPPALKKYKINSNLLNNLIEESNPNYYNCANKNIFSFLTLFNDHIKSNITIDDLDLTKAIDKWEITDNLKKLNTYSIDIHNIFIDNKNSAKCFLNKILTKFNSLNIYDSSNYIKNNKIIKKNSNSEFMINLLLFSFKLLRNNTEVIDIINEDLFIKTYELSKQLQNTTNIDSHEKINKNLSSFLTDEITAIYEKNKLKTQFNNINLTSKKESIFKI